MLLDVNGQPLPPSDETKQKEFEEWCEANPLVGPLLPAIFKPIAIGNRWRGQTREREDGSLIETKLSKKDRRVARGIGMRGRVDRTLDSSRQEQQEVARLATNSHERKRYRELLAKTKRAKREAQKIVLREAAERLAASTPDLSAPTSTESSSSSPSSSPTSAP